MIHNFYFFFKSERLNFSTSEILCLFDVHSPYGTMIFHLIHNLTSYLRCSAGVIVVRALNTLLVRVKSDSIHSFLQFERTSNDSETPQVWHCRYSLLQQACKQVFQKLHHCLTNKAVEDDERASKVCNWLLWSLAIICCLLQELLQLALGLNCSLSSVNSYSTGKPCEPRVSLPSTCC